MENGLRLAGETGANPEVIEYFALLHDSQRWNEGHDPEHGPRAAEFARSLRKSCVRLSNPEFESLYTACYYHTTGTTVTDVTVQTCLDADRLDLGRVNITPEPEYLFTKAAKEGAIIEWARERSCSDYAPPIIHSWSVAWANID
jgi:uncharacterized protein